MLYEGMPDGDLRTELKRQIMRHFDTLTQASAKIYKDSRRLGVVLSGNSAISARSLAVILSRTGIERDHAATRLLLLLWLQESLGVEGPRLLERAGLDL